MDSVSSAERLLKDGAPKKAAAMASKALAKLKQTGSAADVVSALQVLTRAHCATQDIQKSQAILKDFRAEFQRKGEQQSETLVICLQGDCYLANGDIEDALSMANEALELAVGQRDKKGEAAALATKAKISTQTGNTDEAITHRRAVAYILHECKDYEGEALELLSVAELHFWQAQHGECVSTAKRAAKIFRDVGHKHAEAGALRVGAEAAWAQGVMKQVRWGGEDDGALPMAMASLELYKEAGIVEGQIDLSNMIAQVLLQMGDFEEASQMVEVAMDKAQMVGNRAALGLALKTGVHALIGRMNARGANATQKSMRELADKATSAASSLVDLWANADKASQSEAHYVNGSALFARGQALKEKKFENALMAADRSVELAREAQQRKSEAAALVLKAQIHFAMSEINPAADALEAADAIYKEEMDVDGKENTSNILRKMRGSYEWSKRKVTPKLDGSGKPAAVEGVPIGATGLNSAYVYIHFDELRGRAAKNIG